MTLSKNKPFVVIGAGGHCAVVIDLILAAGGMVAGVASPKIPIGEHVYRQIPSVGDDEHVMNSYPAGEYVIALGMGDRALRKALFERFSHEGYEFPPLLHPAATVSPTAELRAGCQLMAGSVVQARSLLYEGVIINTKASVDHDCAVGAFSHVAPNACLCGSVDVGTMVHIGAGATVVQEISLSADTFIKAGSCVRYSQ